MTASTHGLGHPALRAVPATIPGGMTDRPVINPCFVRCAGAANTGHSVSTVLCGDDTEARFNHTPREVLPFRRNLGRGAFQTAPALFPIHPHVSSPSVSEIATLGFSGREK